MWIIIIFNFFQIDSFILEDNDEEDEDEDDEDEDSDEDDQVETLFH